MSPDCGALGGILSAVGGLGAAVATAFAAYYARRTWQVYQQQEKHMFAGNEIQKSLEALARKAESAERRAREAAFAPNLLLKNPRGVFVDWEPEGTEPPFRLRIEWEVHNLGKGPAQDLQVAAVNALDALPGEPGFVAVAQAQGRPLGPGGSCWASARFPEEISRDWAEFIRISGMVFRRDLTQFDLGKLKQYTGRRPAIVVRCRDVFGNPSSFAADVDGNMRFVGTPFGGGS